MKSIACVVLLVALAGCGKKAGKTCDTDGDCDGKQQCWCEHAPLTDQCVNKDDLPAGECVSNDAWVKRSNAKENELQQLSERLAAEAVKKLYPKCVEQLKVLGATPNALYQEYSARVEGTVEYPGQICASTKDKCEAGPWRVRVRVYVGSKFDGIEPHYTSGYVEETSRPLPENHADVFLDQACR